MAGDRVENFVSNLDSVVFEDKGFHTTLPVKRTETINEIPAMQNRNVPINSNFSAIADKKTSMYHSQGVNFEIVNTAAPEKQKHSAIPAMMKVIGVILITLQKFP